MDVWVKLLLPFALLLGRISAFFAVLPLFSWRALPMRIRAAMALMVTIFFAIITPRPALADSISPLAAGILLAREIICGLALGMAARFVFMSVQQGGRYIGRQMGLAMAQVMDPTTGERTQPIGMFFDMIFALFFLAAGYHRLLVLLIGRSYQVWPVGTTPTLGALTEGLVKAGSVMLLFALKLAAPLLAAFLVLSVVLAILARILPEMNILMTSFPLRIGLGIFMAAAIMPTMSSFTAELGQWMSQFLIR